MRAGAGRFLPSCFRTAQRPVGVREDQIGPLGGRTVTGDRGDDAADLFEPGQRGSNGVLAPSVLASGRVSTSLQLGPQITNARPSTGLLLLPL